MKIYKLRDTIDEDFGAKYCGKKVKTMVIEESRRNFKWLKWTMARNKDIRLHSEVWDKIHSRQRLKLDYEITGVLDKIDCPISKALKRLNRIYVNSQMVDVKYVEKKNMFKFKTPLKKGYNMVKIGKFVNKLMTDNGILVDTANPKFGFVNVHKKDSLLEDFVNNFKVYYKSKALENFEIVKGQDIVKYYNYSKYDEHKGTLGSSCMRYDECKNYMGIYSSNENVKMLIYKKPNGKISGRALLWEGCTLKVNGKHIENVTFMDRIYYTSESVKSAFLKYADDNNLVCKSKQSYQELAGIKMNGQNLRGEIRVKLGKIRGHSHYPYMDTLCYLDPINDVASNSTTGMNGKYYTSRGVGDYVNDYDWDYIIGNY